MHIDLAADPPLFSCVVVRVFTWERLDIDDGGCERSIWLVDMSVYTSGIQNVQWSSLCISHSL